MPTNHDAMDDMAAWSAQHRATVMLGCTGNCRQGRECTCWPRAAEACTELGADTAPRFGLIERLRRWWHVAKLKASITGLEHSMAELGDTAKRLESLTWPGGASDETRLAAFAQLHVTKCVILDEGRKVEQFKAEIERIHAGGAL